ncbi:hypothetical protein DB346_06265 [Verrucomicrobia bacterium LW23]|nr:hypothetical protein DB346_06265 [Verrucomicrobia bacterium LW23]
MRNRQLSRSTYILILITLPFLNACGDPNTLSRKKMQAVKVGMTAAEVKAIVGEPQDVETTSTHQFTAEYHRYTSAPTGAASLPDSSAGPPPVTFGILYMQDKVYRVDLPNQDATP